LETTRVSAPASAASTPQVRGAPLALSPGRHLAVALIPRGGATEDHPALFVIKGDDGDKPAVVVTDQTPDVQSAPAVGDAATTTSQTVPSSPAPAAVFPFKLPKAPGPNDSQALATNTTDGGIAYDVVYSLVTVQNGDKVDETNSAYALASCTRARPSRSPSSSYSSSATATSSRRSMWPRRST
jgi:hypothetical protein